MNNEVNGEDLAGWNNLLKSIINIRRVIRSINYKNK